MTCKELVSNKTAQPLNAFRALPVYPVFQDEKLTGSEKQLVIRKIAKKDRITIIIAGNLV